MNLVEKEMMCRICHDKSHARNMEGDVCRIYSRAEELSKYAKQHGYDLSLIEMKDSLFNIRGNNKYTICKVHQHAMCGCCNEINNYVRNANRIGEQIEEIVIKMHFLLLKLKKSEDEKDKETYGYLKNNLLRLLGGFYPNAAHIISCS